MCSNIFYLQEQLQRLIAERTNDNTVMIGEQSPTIGEMRDYLLKQSFYLQLEVIELIESIAGSNDVMKPWKQSYADIGNVKFETSDAIKSEAIDMLCFCINMCLAVGITKDNVLHEYSKVFNKNTERQLNGY